MNRVFLSIALAALGAIIVALVLSHPASAQGFTLSLQDGVNAAKGDDQVTDLFGETGIFKTVTDVLLFVIGAVSVIMLIIGGFKYVVSGGESSAVNGAKNTILYAIVGVIVAILAYAAIDFVIQSFAPNGGVSV